MSNPERRSLLRDSFKSIHLVAICGTGMTALAGMLKASGYSVSGSDENVYPPMSDFLAELGIEVKLGYDASHLEPRPDLAVIGNAMSRGNAEVEAILDLKIPYVSLPFALSEFFIRGHLSCVVAGTHGKTTTSSLLAWILEYAGRGPGFFIGGLPGNFGRGFKLGIGDVFVSEGDEYDSAFFDKRSKFLHYRPDLVILNNIEFDHADIFRDMDEVEIAFSRLINLIPRSGHLIANCDDPVVRKLCRNTHAPLISFGLSRHCEWRAENICTNEDGIRFEVYQREDLMGSFSIPAYGEHMVRNCLAVIVAGTVLRLSHDEIRRGLGKFKNVKRRLQLIGEANEIRIYDDFAHHPTEVDATISALRAVYPERRLWAIFEPRTATSKRKLFEPKYIEAFNKADRVILTPLYRQDKVPPNERLSIDAVSQGLNRKKITNWILPAGPEMLSFLSSNVLPDDIVLFMSNGDFSQIPARLLIDLNKSKR